MMMPLPMWRTTCGRYRDIDFFRINRRIMRNMGRIAEQDSQSMLAGRQRDRGLSLARAKVKMIEIIRYRFVEPRQVSVDQ